ncbi:MAG: YihY/virulence factor BrkB family protein [Gammaproteobacteria bacterium]
MKLAIKQAYSWFTRLVWEHDLRQLSIPRKVVVFIARVLHMLVRELLGGQLNLRAMSLVYTTLLSLVPLLAVSFSVLKELGVHNQIEPMLYNFLKPLGPEGAGLAEKIVSFVDNVEVGVLGSVGVVLLIYTVIALMQKIESAFNFVWQVEHLRPIVRRISSYLSVVLIGPVMLFIATVLSSDIARHLVAIKPFAAVLLSAGEWIPYLLVCLTFAFVYILIPNTRVQVRAALVGGVIAGIVWKFTGWGFSVFIASSSKYAAIYSSFAIFILLLIWLYMNWLILLVGSQIAFFVQYPKFMTLNREQLVLSNRLRERLAIQIMYLVACDYYHDRSPWSLEALVEKLDLPRESVQRVVSILVEYGYLAEVAGEVLPVYLPEHAIENMRLADMLADVRRAGENRFLNSQQLKPIRIADRVLLECEAVCRETTGDRTIKDLVLAGNGKQGC